MKSLIQMISCNLREWAREPGALFWSFGFPILMSIAFGLALGISGLRRGRGLGRLVAACAVLIILWVLAEHVSQLVRMTET